jgi:hypothetical protein
MKKPIESGAGEQRIGKEIGPLAGSAVGSEQDTALLIAFSNDIIEVMRTWGGERLETEVVNDEEVRPQIGGETPLEGIIGASPVEMLEHAVSIDEKDSEALDTRCVGQPCCNMTFNEAIMMLL